MHLTLAPRGLCEHPVMDPEDPVIVIVLCREHKQPVVQIRFPSVALTYLGAHVIVIRLIHI